QQPLRPTDAVEAAVAEPDGLDARRAQAIHAEPEEGLLPEILRAGELRLVAGRDGDGDRARARADRGREYGEAVLPRRPVQRQQEPPARGCRQAQQSFGEEPVVEALVTQEAVEPS